jgi:uncharacterized protein (DUF302 family)
MANERTRIMSYALTTVVDRPFVTVLPEVRAALTDQGFGVLTEIDLAATETG